MRALVGLLLTCLVLVAVMFVRRLPEPPGLLLRGGTRGGSRPSARHYDAQCGARVAHNTSWWLPGGPTEWTRVYWLVWTAHAAGFRPRHYVMLESVRLLGCLTGCCSLPLCLVECACMYFCVHMFV